MSANRTEISITTTEHSQAIPTIAGNVENREGKRLIQLQRSYVQKQTPDKRQALILAPVTNHLKQHHYKMAVIQEAGLETQCIS